jgi:ABC-type antimicrobial peptide transport system permease subunit
LAADPLVSMVAAASPTNTRRFALARAASTSIGGPLTYRFASADFFEVMGIALVRGRGFLPSERDATSGTVVVSARVAARLWPHRDAVGQVVRLQFDKASTQNAVVAGVVRSSGTFRGLDLGLDPDLYLPASPDTVATDLVLRVRDDPFRARARLIDRLTRIDPALGSVTTLQTMVGLIAYVMGALFALGVMLGALALLLTVSGLFSALSYIVEQRTREIGVRMALGASARGIVQLVFIESSVPVGIGLATGALLAAAVAGVLMASPLASEVKGIVNVFDPAAYASGLAVIVLACTLAASVPALRAVRVVPSVMLRKD